MELSGTEEEELDSEDEFKVRRGEEDGSETEVESDYEPDDLSESPGFRKAQKRSYKKGKRFRRVIF